MADLPYETEFQEKNIPTKAHPIQINADLEQHLGYKFRIWKIKV